MHEATALISPMEERMPLVVPVKTKEYRGCVEKWMVQVRKGEESFFPAQTISCEPMANSFSTVGDGDEGVREGTDPAEFGGSECLRVCIRHGQADARRRGR